MAVPSVTILNGETVSDAVDLDGTTLVGIFVPSTFEGTTIKFQTSLDGDTYFDVEDGSGSDTDVTVGTVPCYVPISPTAFVGIRLLKLVAGTAQTGDCDIQLASRPV